MIDIINVVFMTQKMLNMLNKGRDLGRTKLKEGKEVKSFKITARSRRFEGKIHGCPK